MAAGEYLRRTYPDMLRVPAQNALPPRHVPRYDFDNTMLRIGSMNMVLHGVEAPAIEYRDFSLAEGAAGDAEAYSLILANPPFAGSLDYENTAKDLQQTVKTKDRAAVLALFLRLLKTGGRAAVIVPDGVLLAAARPTKNCAASWWKSKASTPSSACLAACSSPTRASAPPSCSSPKP